MSLSSRDPYAEWRAKYGAVVQQGKVGLADAHRKLRLAERNRERAEAQVRSDPDLAIVLAEAALLNAADAVLAKDGYRTRGKSGSHRARFDYPGLPAAFAKNRALLEEMRRLRSQLVYEDFGIVTPQQAQDIVAEVGRLTDAVRTVIPASP